LVVSFEYQFLFFAPLTPGVSADAVDQQSTGTIEIRIAFAQV